MRLLSRLTRRRSTLSQCCCSVSNSPTYTPPLFLHVTSLSRTLVISSLRGTPASWPRTKPKGCVCTCLCVCTCVFVWVWVCVCDVAEDVVIKRIDLAICNTSSSVVRRLTLMEEATAETWLAIYRRSTPSANTHTHTLENVQPYDCDKHTACSVFVPPMDQIPSVTEKPFKTFSTCTETARMVNSAISAPPLAVPASIQQQYNHSILSATFIHSDCFSRFCVLSTFSWNWTLFCRCFTVKRVTPPWTTGSALIRRGGERGSVEFSFADHKQHY